MIEFFIPGVPVPKGRPRFSRRGSFVSTYTPKKTLDYEKHVKSCASQYLLNPLEGPLSVSLAFVLPVPSSASKKLTLSLLNAPHVKKPDIDNLAKAVLDGMIGVVFLDDGQVWNLTASKVYGIKPGVLIRVSHNPQHYADNDGPSCAGKAADQKPDSSQKD